VETCYQIDPCDVFVQETHRMCNGRGNNFLITMQQADNTVFVCSYNEGCPLAKGRVHPMFRGTKNRGDELDPGLGASEALLMARIRTNRALKARDGRSTCSFFRPA